MVYTECAEMAAVSCGTSHASAVSTPLQWIFFLNAPWKASHSCRITCERSESAWEQRIALYKSDQHNTHLVLWKSPYQGVHKHTYIYTQKQTNWKWRGGGGGGAPFPDCSTLGQLLTISHLSDACTFHDLKLKARPATKSQQYNTCWSHSTRLSSKTLTWWTWWWRLSAHDTHT